MLQPRQPKGVPTGGQWRAARRPEGVVDLSARSEAGPLQMVGTTTGPFTWSAWPDDWQQYAGEPPGLAAEARAGASTRLWAEVQRTDGRWAWSVERLDEAGAGLSTATVAAGESFDLLEALRAAGAAADRDVVGSVR